MLFFEENIFEVLNFTQLLMLKILGADCHVVLSSFFADTALHGPLGDTEK